MSSFFPQFLRLFLVAEVTAGLGSKLGSFSFLLGQVVVNCFLRRHLGPFVYRHNEISNWTMKICSFTIFAVRSSINSSEPVSLATVHPRHVQSIDVKSKPELSQRQTCCLSSLFLKFAEKKRFWSVVGATCRSSSQILTSLRLVVRLTRLLRSILPFVQDSNQHAVVVDTGVSSVSARVLVGVCTHSHQQEAETSKLDHRRSKTGS